MQCLSIRTVTQALTRRCHSCSAGLDCVHHSVRTVFLTNETSCMFVFNQALSSFSLPTWAHSSACRSHSRLRAALCTSVTGGEPHQLLFLDFVCCRVWPTSMLFLSEQRPSRFFGVPPLIFRMDRPCLIMALQFCKRMAPLDWDNSESQTRISSTTRPPGRGTFIGGGERNVR